MMQPPMIYALLGLVPGLGFFLLGDKKKFVSSISFFGILVVVILLPLHGEIRFMAGIVAIIFLFWRIVYTFQIASKKEVEEEGISTVKEIQTVSILVGTSSWSQEKFKVSGILSSQLNDLDDLVASISCQKNFIFSGLERKFYLGITDRNLEILQLDLGGKPYKFEKYPIEQIEWVKLRKKFLDPGKLICNYVANPSHENGIFLLDSGKLRIMILKKRWLRGRLNEMKLKNTNPGMSLEISCVQ